MVRNLVPKSTQIPDVILDHWMLAVSGAEVKVLLYAAEAGERRRAKRRRDALNYARQVYADPIIGGSWRSVESIVGESYGRDVAAAVVKELQGEGSE